MDQNHPRPADERLAVVAISVLAPGIPDLDAYRCAGYTGRLDSDSGRPLAPVLDEAERALFALPAAQARLLDEEDRLLLKVVAAQDSDPARSVIFSSRAGRLARAASPRFALSPEEEDGSAAELLESCLLHAARRHEDFSLTGNPLYSALQAARQALADDALERVILCGAAWAPHLAPVAAAAGIQLAEKQTFGFDAAAAGWSFGSSAVALGLMRESQARAQGKTIYATLAGWGYAAREGASPRLHLVPTFVSADTVAAACRRAFENAAVQPAAVGYLETLASGFTPLDSAEIKGLGALYGRPELTCAIGSAQALTGFLPGVSGLFGLARAALSLADRFFPPTPEWSGPKKAELFATTPFYIPPEAQAWFQPTAQGPRRAALNSIGWDGSALHLILAEPAAATEPCAPAALLARPSTHLLPVAAHSPAGLLTGLSALKARLDEGEDLFQTASLAYRDLQRGGNTQEWTVALVAADRAEALKELETALRAIPNAIEKNSPWQTPAGSFFTPAPLGPAAPVAFVYPGAFNSYLGLGRDLFNLFPRLHHFAARLTADLGATLQERLLYPRSLSPLAADALKTAEARLNADPIAMITSGSLVAVLYTYILREIFKLNPSAAFGYSLGEIGMLFAMNVWDQADAVRARLSASPLFAERLSGAKTAVRQAWQSAAPVEWENYFVMAPVEAVRAALAAEDRVYLTHINTPRQVVIGGDAAACKRVLTGLKAMSLRAPFDFALHCAAMRSEQAALQALLTWPVACPSFPRLYTAAGNRPLPAVPETIAADVSAMLCSPLDFVALARQVYADGAKVFIEIGANANCTKWIEESLKGEPLAAVAVNRKGVADLTALVRLLARLTAHRVPLDLSPLYGIPSA